MSIQKLTTALPPSVLDQLIPEVFAPLLAQAARLMENVPFAVVTSFIQYGLRKYDEADSLASWEAGIRREADRLLAADPDDLETIAGHQD